MLRFLLSSAFLLCMSAASAQTAGVAVAQGRVRLAPTGEQVRVSLSINMFIATPEDEGAQVLKAQEDGRKMIYEAATRECETLRAAIASDCRLESININVQRMFANQGYGQRNGYNISGSISYRIDLK